MRRAGPDAQLTGDTFGMIKLTFLVLHIQNNALTGIW